MDRRRYPQQQYVPPGMVDFGQINFGHDIVAQQMPGILQNYQQRWDMQDAAIAKLLEEQAGTQMLEGDAQAVGNLLKSSFDEIDTLVKGTYQGDRGAAAMDIVKKLSAAKAPLAQAKSEKERYDKAFAEYQQSLHSGKVPHIIDPLTKQRRIQNFDEYHRLQGQQAFTNKGYTPRQYNALRGAADMEGYLADNVSKALNAASNKGGLDHYDENDVMGMLVHYSTSGATDKEIQYELSEGKGVQFVKQLRSGIPFLNEEYQEYEQKYGTEEANKHILDRAINIVKGQVSNQYAEGYIRNPGYSLVEQNNNPQDPYYGLYTRHTVEDEAKVKAKRKELNNILSYIDSPYEEEIVNVGNVLGGFGTKQATADNNKKREEQLQSLKQQFNSIWNYIDQNAVELLDTLDVDEKAKNKLFIQHLINLDLPANLAKENNLIISPTNTDVYKDLKVSLQRQMSNSKLYSGDKEKLGGEAFGNNGENIQNIEFVPSKGNIVFTVKDGSSIKEYSLKDKDMANLPTELKLTLQTIEKLYEGKFDYQFDTNSIESPVFVNMNVQGINIPVKPTFTWTINPKTGQKTFTKKYQVIKNGELEYITDGAGNDLEEPVTEFQDIINPFFARIAATQGVTN